MRMDPYIHVDKLKAEYAAFFIIRLSSISPARGDTRGFAQAILNQQSDFIATLVGMGEGTAIELRFICSPQTELPPEGRVDISMRIKVCDTTAVGAQQAAATLFRSFMPNLLSLSNLYTWSAVSSAEEYDRLVPESLNWHVKEMVRRERHLNLEKLPEPIVRNHIGFTQHSDVLLPAEPGKVYVCFPFLRNYKTLKGLFTELLYQHSKVVISVRLEPTVATDEEFQFMQAQLAACERYMQLPVSGSVADPAVFFPSFRQQSSVLAEQVQNELSILRDEVFFTTIHVMSEAPLSQMLCESLGVTVTEHLQTTDPESDVGLFNRSLPFNGGYDWIEPQSAAEQALAIDRIKLLEYAGISNGLLDKPLRIRRLFGVNQASCAFRLPVPRDEDFPGLETTRVRYLRPPIESKAGLVLGLNTFGSSTNRVSMQAEDRLRHTYVVGKTGTGKSTFLKNSIMQDILAGEGVGLFDPHGELVDEIINYIPEHRLKDVVLVKPELEHCSIGLNIFDVKTDLQKDSVINYLIEVFHTIFDMSVAGGPVFEMYFRNAALLLLGEREPPATIMDLHRVFEDRKFRNQQINACADPMVVQFWKGQAMEAQGDLGLSNMAPYITSKLVRLTHTFTMRRIFSQPYSTIDFDDIIENKRILLVDLSKGALGSLSSSFLGMSLIKLIQIVAFKRTAKNAGSSPEPFYLYFDEFQNLATPSFLDLLSESRKYGLAMTLANQYIHQIPENIRNALFGNVGAIVSFRVGLSDAKVLEDSFAPSVTTGDFINLPNFNAYVSMLSNGDVCRPFNIATQQVNYSASPGASQAIMEQMGNYTMPAK